MRHFSFGILFIVVGCSSAKVSDCSKVDWRIVGRIDEELSNPTTKTKMRHKNHCGAKFNEPLWHEGRMVGALFHCTDQGAYYAAKMELPFPSKCDEKLHKALNVAYQDGLKVKQYQQDISISESELSEAKEAEAKKASQKSSWSQELGRWMFSEEPRSTSLQRTIDSRREDIRVLEAKYPPPYSFKYP